MFKKSSVTVLILLVFTTLSVKAAPQGPYNEPPAPYDYQYRVDHPPTETFFGQSEQGDPNGRVAGSYYVYLPDGRLMTVEYSVDGDSGFVPRISFQQQGPNRPI